ncbi:MAG: hypothetical protein J7K26_00375, partial [Candidatus Aenigmarchaeota archaeon]|nr:hypothetical protein [Candidatus Aenigmarchaeota archaeon]
KNQKNNRKGIYILITIVAILCIFLTGINMIKPDFQCTPENKLAFEQCANKTKLLIVCRDTTRHSEKSYLPDCEIMFEELRKCGYEYSGVIDLFNCDLPGNQITCDMLEQKTNSLIYPKYAILIHSSLIEPLPIEGIVTLPQLTQACENYEYINPDSLE